MSRVHPRILSPERIASYEECGFIHSIPILTPEEVRHYRDQLEKTWAALGGRIARADGLHLYFRWAWDLATHDRLLDCMEDLLGPVIVLKHTRFFYKYGKSAAWVGWHQDGFTERLTEGRAPAIWLGLTEATVENGCLSVVPRSHRMGICAHSERSKEDDLATSSMEVGGGTPSNADNNDLSIKLATLPEGLDSPYDVVMRAGEMSFHHPLSLHGSNPNRSDGPRIGLSATYSSPELYRGGGGAALVRGNAGPLLRFEVSRGPGDRTLEDAAAAYRASGRQILRVPD